MEQLRRRVVSDGTRLRDSIAQRRHRPDYQIVLYVGLLMLLGLVIMYAIGPQRANVLNQAYGTDTYTATYFVVKQAVSLLLAGVAFTVMASLPFGLVKKHASTLLLIGLGLCVLLFVTGNLLHISSIAQCSLGACRWFEFGSLGSFQPAEFLKFGLLMYMAVFLGIRSNQGKLNDLTSTIYPMLAVTLLGLFFVVIVQKDLGTGVALASIAFSILLVSGISTRIMLKIVLGALAVGILAIVIAPHRIERVTTFLQGESAVTGSSSSDDANYHIKNAMIALGTGGIFGLGIGNSVQATGYLPEAINDSVFAILGEIFGFIGVVAILVAFGALLMRLLHIIDYSSDITMKLAVAGIWGWLASHIVLNVASMVGIFPLTGITLPLLSFGGTSMLFIAGALGMAFQISRYTLHQLSPVKETNGNETTLRRRGIGGSRYSGRRRYQ
ncbi:MAG: FtsW/RodA/SpoVE family cell cycle protein [Candidatus Saccharimonas aalborgensis]